MSSLGYQDIRVRKSSQGITRVIVRLHALFREDTKGISRPAGRVRISGPESPNSDMTISGSRYPAANDIRILISGFRLAVGTWARKSPPDAHGENLGGLVLSALSWPRIDPSADERREAD